MKTIDCIISDWSQGPKQVKLTIQPLAGETLCYRLPVGKVNINNLKNHNGRLVYVKYGGRKRLSAIAIDGMGDRDKFIYGH